MDTLYIHGPNAKFNAGYAASRVPDGARVWFYGTNTGGFFPPITWHLTDPSAAALMLDDASTLIRKRQGASTFEPLVVVLHDVDAEFIDTNDRVLRDIVNDGPAVNVHLIVTTRDRVKSMALLADEMVSIDDFETLANIALEIAESQSNPVAEQNLLTMAQVYMSKALLQELRGGKGESRS